NSAGLGGALAAILVGPWTGVLCFGVVLLMQGILFADGGLTALGVNITVMGVVTVVVAYGLFRGLVLLLPRTRASVTAASFVAALVSVPAAAAAFTALYAIGGTTDVPVSKVLTAMVGVHVLIGIGDPAAVTEAELPALRRRVQAVLLATQILGGLGIATGVALAAVLARDVSGSEALSGLASTATVAGPALLAMPLAALMASRGRRAGLVLAYLIGAVGAGVAVLGAVAESFPLLLLGLVGFGAGSSANLAARFAAADLAPPDRRARAISTVVWATTIGAVLGPNIAAPAGKSVAGLGIPATAGPFVWAAGVFVIAAVVVAVLLRPDPLLTARALNETGAGEAPDERSLRAGMRAVRESPKARLAVVTVAGSHTAMVSIMSMTPVA
ncbi:MFS transporter, partial [Streptomyces massasporeus]